jgi:uncharacterized protein with von Willebrand factor type A (vWA) domain
MIKYTSSRHSFSGSSSTSKRDQDLEREKDLEKYLNELNLNKQKEKNIKKDIKDIKQKGVKEESSQVNSAYYTVDNEANKNVEELAEICRLAAIQCQSASASGKHSLASSEGSTNEAVKVSSQFPQSILMPPNWY